MQLVAASKSIAVLAAAPLILQVLFIPAYASEEEWRTHYAVNGFVNSGPADPHQIFKIHYRVLNGTIERFDMPYVEYAHYIQARVNSEGNSMLEIRFPKNYPSSDASGGDLLDAIIFFNELEILSNQVYDNDCFMEFSIPFSGNGTIDVVWTTIFMNQFHGVDVPDDCIPETIVQNVARTKDGIISPLHQLKAGVRVNEVTCGDEFKFILHPNGKPYCVSPDSLDIIKERWNIE